MDVQLAGTVTAQQQAPPPPAASAGGLHFGDILSALNPLQYLPVVGTIYRAVTNDTIPEPLRIGGSFLVSVLTGGPVGLLLGAATTVALKATGIDPEAMAHDLFAELGLTTYDAPAKAPPAQLAAAQRAGYLPAPAPASTPAPTSAPMPAPMPAVDPQAALDSYRRSLVTA